MLDNLRQTPTNLRLELPKAIRQFLQGPLLWLPQNAFDHLEQFLISDAHLPPSFFTPSFESTKGGAQRVRLRDRKSTQ